MLTLGTQGKSPACRPLHSFSATQPTPNHPSSPCLHIWAHNSGGSPLPHQWSCWLSEPGRLVAWKLPPCFQCLPCPPPNSPHLLLIISQFQLRQRYSVGPEDMLTTIIIVSPPAPTWSPVSAHPAYPQTPFPITMSWPPTPAEDPKMDQRSWRPPGFQPSLVETCYSTTKHSSQNTRGETKEGEKTTHPKKTNSEIST